MIVDGAVVFDGSPGGGNNGPDCAKTENRPVCQAIQFAAGLNACPAGRTILVDPQGRGIEIFCQAHADGPPPVDVYVNGECVPCG